jgi:hypothetical protein
MPSESPRAHAREQVEDPPVMARIDEDLLAEAAAREDVVQAARIDDAGRSHHLTVGDKM